MAGAIYRPITVDDCYQAHGGEANLGKYLGNRLVSTNGDAWSPRAGTLIDRHKSLHSARSGRAVYQRND